MSARDPLRNALPLLIEAAERYVNQAGRWPVRTNARARQDAYLAEISQALANAREALAAVPAEPEAICNRCHAPKGRQAIGEGCNNCGGRVVANPVAEPEEWEYRATFGTRRTRAHWSMAVLRRAMANTRIPTDGRAEIERRRPGTAPGEWERVDPEPRDKG